MGAGDEVPASLTQLGYAVTLLTPAEITSQKLQYFDVVITNSMLIIRLQHWLFKQRISFWLLKSG
jgi:hypothetical protein